MANDETEFLGKASKRLGLECESLNRVNKQIAALEEQISELKKYRDEKASELADSFLAAGIQHARFHGRTYYLHTNRGVRKATDVSQEEVCESLRHAGLDSFIKEQYSPAQLTAHLKEIHNEMEAGTPFEDSLPTPMKGLFYIFEKSTLRSRV